MLRIGQVEVTATSDGKYTDGSVAGGIAATRLRAAAFNAIQEELAHIVEAAGLTLSVTDNAQVYSALQALYQPKDAMLTAFSNLNTVNMQFPVFNGPKSMEVGALTNLSLLFLSKATAADMLSLLTAAPLASPTFTGDPKAPTPSPGDNDTSIATTAFVASAIAALGTAASRNVGTSTNQIPDMTSFTSGANWFKLPNGFIVQFFVAVMADTSAASKVVNFPFAFPNAAISVVATHNGPQPGAAGIFGINNLSKTTFQSYTSVTPTGSIGAFIIAVGY